jgi:hypothetical protein
LTNADAEIPASGRPRGRIKLAFAPPVLDWLARWRAELRRLRVPATLDWRHEVVGTDDGEGMNAELVDLRMGALGERQSTTASAGDRNRCRTRAAEGRAGPFRSGRPCRRSRR